GDLLDDVSASGETLVFVSEGQHARPMLRAARKAFKGDAAKEARLKRILKQIADLETTAARLFPHEAPATREAAPPLKVFGFGPGRVELGGETIPTTAWGSSTARQLFFYMLVHSARSREQIFADFWPELTPQKAKASFHTTKFRLNRALGRDAIDYDGRLYMLHPDLKVWFDVAAFRELLEEWRQTEEIDVLAKAVELYTGDFLTECYMDWCEMEREVLRVRCLEALETLAERLLSRRQYRRAIRTLRQALTVDPARETFHQQLMRAYALAGQRSRALAQYQRCVTSLREELGAAPSHVTTDLYDRIKVEAPLD
ncbi:MAG: AfsR/SARP family transcriptional regulator, partial [Anaerolineae bacterium]